MPRTARIAPAGLIYHVLNRSVGRMHLFRNERDFLAFERIMLQAHERFELPILSYCIMSNHWHFAVRPREDGQLSDFFRWLTHTHAMRWRVSHRTVGYGHLYQGRFKSFPVQEDQHALTMCRYIERNALSAGLVKRAEDWRWSSLWTRENGSDELRAMLSDWRIDRPRNWIAQVNAAITPRELERLRISIARGRPYGDERWTTHAAKRLELGHTLRSEGRPKKPKPEN